MAGRVVSLNISDGGIPKRPLPTVVVETERLAGDAHDHAKHDTPQQAMSLLDAEDLDDLRLEGYDVGPGSTGENVTLRGVEVDTLAVGDRIRFAGGVTVELTKRRNPCFVLDAIDPAFKTAIAGRCGFYAKVLVPGQLDVGATVTVEPAGAAVS